MVWLTAVVTFLLGLLLREYLPGYFREKGKNLATKEDIAGITREIEAVRSVYTTEIERLQALNDAYKAKFGFPFIMAVKGRARREILRAFEERVDNDAETEFATALLQVERIALLRVETMLP